MSGRALRAWLGLWIVLMLCATYIAWWVFYASMHQRIVGVQQPPGQSALTADGIELRILSMHQSREVPGSYETVEAVPGATFVLVAFEATVPETGSFCHTELIGRDGQHWGYTTKVSGRPGSFSCHEFEPGGPVQGEIIFEVPEAEVDHLMGMKAAYETDAFYRAIVIRPGGQP